MNDMYCTLQKKKKLLLRLTLSLLGSCLFTGYVHGFPGKALAVAQQTESRIVAIRKTDATKVELKLANHEKRILDFYGDHIFRMFQDYSGQGIREPEAKPEARILVDAPRKALSSLTIAEIGNSFVVSTGKIKIIFDKNSGLYSIVNLATNKAVLEEVRPVVFAEKRVTLSLKENPAEYFFGGGMQNGRFSHKGKAIAIENTNSWTNGGVASPTPFYWSTQGYGLMWHTFKKGKYDFGANEKGVVAVSHDTDYLDIFFMINDGAVALLNDFYQLTGNPVLFPKFGFYEGHLNAYNRDFWKEDPKGILFEDGKRYKESQKDNGGIRESLNGEKDNYQFSARAVIDRYKSHDMPLGWLLPNDGYGAGYGQAETLDGNIENLKNLTGYASLHGVQIGLWTQSDLHPKPEISALLQRDIIKEVRDAGVRVLKTDVAWVGAGYSFGLNGIADVSQIMMKYGNGSRPFIISLDGWAGTQRYAGLWSGDQTGGVWEYIRFHIPTYIGSGLSGNPNVGSDMDGIFGGKNPIVNMRDFQWKMFTPLQLNMDGWGANEKYPQALGEPATSINRWYLKMKSEIMPYFYTVAHEAVSGKPMIRAMMLDYPNAYTLGKSTQYQFLFGPSFLVAPIYKNTQSDTLGNDIRDGIYLPEGQWIDYFSGDMYTGGRILNNFEAPIWKLPVFIKNGAIIPLTNANNNVTEINPNLRIYELYPSGETSFTEYDDDGTTTDYLQGKSVSTRIESHADKNGKAVVKIHPTEGSYNGFVKNKMTEFRVNVTKRPASVSAAIGSAAVKLREVKNMADFQKNTNVWFYEAAPELNRFATRGSNFEKICVKKNPLVRVKLKPADITANATILTVRGFEFKPADQLLTHTGTLSTPAHAVITEQNTGPYTLTPTWDNVENADYYEIEFQGMNYSTIRNTSLAFENLAAETPYTMRLRAVNASGVSDWVSLKATTKNDPLEFAIRNISITCSAENQGSSMKKLFDLEEGELWHTKYGVNALPFDLTVDLNSVNELDKCVYVPRDNAGNGTITKVTVSYSMDKKNWTAAGNLEWARDNKPKEFRFTDKPTARYIKLSVTEAVGGFGSGKELYVFRVPGSESYLPGDINNDRLIDTNDLTSYINYTGLRQGDADFEGYISKGDLNKNGLIDAYDISVVATRLKGGAKPKKTDEAVSGRLTLLSEKSSYSKADTIKIVVKGHDLKNVNALSFALPYHSPDYEFIGIQPLNMKAMENMTNDRLHTNGVKALYPTFVNIGDQEALNGDFDLFIIKFKAKRNVRFDLELKDGFLVDNLLNIANF